MNADTKRKLRREKRQQRNALPAAAQQRASRRLLQNLRQLPEYRRAQRLAGYLANDGELSLAPLFRHARLQGKHCYLPVLQSATAMSFYSYSPGQVLHKNSVGIAEPGRRQAACPLSKLDVILLPLVAFDRHGGRLGMGGGYYDRSLKGRQGNGGPMLIGVAHALQEVSAVPSDSWDVPLDAIVTDKEVIRPPRKPRRRSAQLRNRL